MGRNLGLQSHLCSKRQEGCAPPCHAVLRIRPLVAKCFQTQKERQTSEPGPAPAQGDRVGRARDMGPVCPLQAFTCLPPPACSSDTQEATTHLSKAGQSTWRLKTSQEEESHAPISRMDKLRSTC